MAGDDGQSYEKGSSRTRAAWSILTIGSGSPGHTISRDPPALESIDVHLLSRQIQAPRNYLSKRQNCSRHPLPCRKSPSPTPTRERMASTCTSEGPWPWPSGPAAPLSSAPAPRPLGGGAEAPRSHGSPAPRSQDVCFFQPLQIGDHVLLRGPLSGTKEVKIHR